MKFTKGIVTDISNIDRKPGSWFSARNAVFSEEYGAVFNEYGFSLLLSLPGLDCGTIPLDNNLAIAFRRDNNNSLVYLVDLKAKTFTLVTSNTVFNLSPTYPITGEYYRNSKGEIVVAFTDNFNPPRILNTTTNYSTALDKLTRIYLKFNSASLNSYTINDVGGSLRTGTYYVSTAYQSIDKSTTAYTTSVGPFYITNSTSSNALNQYIGAQANQSSSKSITLNYTGVDTDYAYLIIALVSKIDGILTTKIVRKIPITSNTLNVTVLGSENEGVVSLTELLTGVDIFSRVKTMTQNNNQLYMADLSKDEIISYQLATLNAQVNFTLATIDITAVNALNPKINPVRSMQADEVMALYLHYVKDDGTVTQGFHMPGRAVAQYGNGLTEFNGHLENSLVTVASGSHIDRAVGIGGSNSKIFQFFETASNPNATTNMAYWENNELYPNSAEYGALQGQPIRHHKFPSLSYIKTTYFNSDNEFGKTKMPRIGISVTNVTLPANCIGYYISAAKRDLNNCTILGQDMLLYSAVRENQMTGSESIWTNCGNWAQQSQDGDLISVNNKIRIHSFDLLINKPSISPSYIQGELLLRNRNIATNYNFSDGSGVVLFQSGVAGQDTFRGRTLTDDEKQQDILVIDYTKGIIITEAVVPRGKSCRINNFAYQPANTQNLGVYMNLGAEECGVAQVVDTTLFPINDLVLHTFNSDKARDNDEFTNGIGSGGVPEEVTYLYNIKQYKDTIYEDFSNQFLFILHTDMKVPTFPSSTLSIVGGDTIISDYSFYAYGPTDSIDNNPHRGVRTVRRYITESINFASYRNEVEGDTSTSFYPDTDPYSFLMDLSRDGQYNKWRYNKDYTAVNDINAITANDPIVNLDFVTEFPERIIRSQVEKVEDSGINDWRTFPVNNYYEMPKNRGPIINIKSDGYNIIINQLYSLFRTRGKIEIATTGGTATLGAGDLFEFPPQELLATEEGYAGCQHQFSCLLTKAGYFFIDAEQGKVYLLSDGLKEISSEGNFRYFLTAFINTLDNPLINNGITVGYDGDYNRILLTNNNTGFTYSYSIDLENWVSFHDYLPNQMFHTRDNLYSSHNNSYYIHNDKIKKGIYYGDTVNPFYIIPTFNEPVGINKYTFVVKWTMEIRKLDGSNQRDESLTHLFMWNSFQATNEVSLTVFKNLIFQAYNTRKAAGIWKFNRFRDLVVDNTQLFVLNNSPILSNIDTSKSLQLKRRFIDHWLNVKFMYDNKPIDGEQRNVYLYEVDVDAKPVER